MKVRVASAGTGKTTSLVLRYLELISSGIPLRRIAGVTFTRKSAHELRQRVAEGIGEVLKTGEFLSFSLAEADREKFIEAKRELEGASLSTIHGFMIESLRLVAPIMGLDPDFSVLGEWEAQAVFEEEMRSLLYLAQDPSHDLYQASKLKHLEENLLALFAKRSLAENFFTDNDPNNQKLLAAYERIYNNFSLRFKASLLSPAEIERQAIKLSKTKPALKRLSSRFKILLIDEYQDLNPLQGEFFAQLEHSGINIEVVGDPKQSIYGFRNADVRVFRKALASGEVLEPLNISYRHARLINRFLNKMTTTLAKNELGFSENEAPLIQANRSAEGHVEIHWVVGEKPIAELRAYEAHILAKRLQHAHEQLGVDYSDMAVLARSYAGLKIIETALDNLELPNVLLQGRGYYDRIEIRDIYNALKLGIDATGTSLAAWLRSPFASGLELADINKILVSENPILTLEQYPEVFERLQLIRQAVKGQPIDALKYLIREKFISGKRYVDFLDKKQRENIDALLFTVVMQAPGEIEYLLDRLEHLSLQTDAGDVPQSGQGIQLLTVHRSKGLEWPLVAVFDLGRAPYHRPSDIYIDADSGRFALKDSDSFEKLKENQKARTNEEDYRLLYVASSRAKDYLLLSGSIKNNKTASWTKALELMDAGTKRHINKPNYIIKTHNFKEIKTTGNNKPKELSLEAAPWIDKTFKRPKYPAVISPSYLKKQADNHEPLNLPDQSQGELIPGKATTIGTLTHDAISQNWQADNKRHLANLQAQELMFPFSESEQEDIMSEVKLLLGNYESMLGPQIAALELRSEDYPELAMVLPKGPTVVQGIIDRIYKADGIWYLEDYKTDKELKPENYHLQLALYFDAVSKVMNIKPIVQLVYLRSKQVVVLAEDLLLQNLADNAREINKEA